MIVVYCDNLNSLHYNLAIPFKDGATFVLRTATQSLQPWDLESVADTSYLPVTKCQILGCCSCTCQFVNLLFLQAAILYLVWNRACNPIANSQKLEDIYTSYICKNESVYQILLEIQLAGTNIFTHTTNTWYPRFYKVGITPILV